MYRLKIENVEEYPTMHYFVIPKQTLSMIAYKIFNRCVLEFQFLIALCTSLVIAFWVCCQHFPFIHGCVMSTSITGTMKLFDPITKIKPFIIHNEMCFRSLTGMY